MITHRFFVLKIIVTIVFAIAVIVGIYKYKRADRLQRFFLYYLIYAFLTNLLTSPFFSLPEPLRKFLFTTFGLIESVFLFYFISRGVRSRFVKILSSTLAVIALPVWLLLMWYFKDPDLQISIYDSSYNIVLSILTAFALLEFAESRQQLFLQPVSWFILATFLSSFCTFFISILFKTSLGRDIWYLYNSVNLVAYICFIVGFLMIKERQNGEVGE